MKTEKFDGCLTAFRWRPLVLAMMLCGVSAGTVAGAKTPTQYHDVGGLPPSPDCTKKFGDNIYLPTPTSKRGHAYVLLLIFKNEETANTAGHKLFYAPEHPDPNNPTWSCVEDSDYAQSVYGESVKTWGLVAKGGCPTDCAAIDQGMLNALYAVQSARAREPQTGDREKDPLGYMKGCPHWAILSTEADNPMEAHVWQIRAADAVHAKAIFASLHDRLVATDGYMGHVVIGYRPRRPLWEGPCPDRPAVRKHKKAAPLAQ
jgi:hypothetical protein